MGDAVPEREYSVSVSSMSSRGSVVELARRMTDSGELQQALELCEREVAQNGSDMNLWSLVAEIHNKLGQRQQALGYYERALPIREEVGDRAGLGTTPRQLAT